MSNEIRESNFRSSEAANNSSLRAIFGGWLSAKACFGAMLVVVTALSGWLRFYYLGARNLWLDEAYSVLFAHMPAGPFWKLMWSREGNMLLYYLLLRGWVLLGDTEILIRTPSVIFAVASIPAIYLLGWALFGRMTGLLTATLLSAHMFHVFLSQQARSYTLLLLLLLLSTLFFLRFTQAPDRKPYLVAYTVVSAMAMYAHVFASLVIASQWLALGRARIHRIGWQRLAAAGALFLVLASPMVAFVLLKNKGQLDWVPALSAHTLLDGIYAMTGYGNWPLLVLYVALALAALAYGANSDYEAFRLRLVELWVAFPLGVMLVYSLHKPILYSRFLLISVPGIILLAAQGAVAIARRRPPLRWISATLVLIMIGLAMRSTWSYLHRPVCPDWKPATQTVVARARPQDAICFAGNGAEVFLYYLQREKQMAWGSLPNVRYSQGARCLGDSPEKIAEATSGFRRAWLLKTDATEESYGRLLQLLTDRFGPPSAQGSFGCPGGKISVRLLAGKSN